jgi:Zn-dependent M28 family amino/carboxypeptidase
LRRRIRPEYTGGPPRRRRVGIGHPKHQRRHGARPRRSILFVIVTAEEKGLLGSHYFARHPTVPKGSIVADFNFDMPLPLWPLKSVFAAGENESTSLCMRCAMSRTVATPEASSMAPL